MVTLQGPPASTTSSKMRIFGKQNWPFKPSGSIKVFCRSGNINHHKKNHSFMNSNLLPFQNNFQNLAMTFNMKIILTT